MLHTQPIPIIQQPRVSTMPSQQCPASFALPFHYTPTIIPQTNLTTPQTPCTHHHTHRNAASSSPIHLITSYHPLSLLILSLAFHHLHHFTLSLAFHHLLYIEYTCHDRLLLFYIYSTLSHPCYYH
jgi:hypothetical protein